MHLSENQFRPKINGPLQDCNFLASYCHTLHNIVNPNNHLKSQSIRNSLSFNKNNTITAEKKRILIVDDEPDIANLYKLSLERDGFVVDVFNDSLLALSSYKAGTYDLLLLDVNMPRMNGFELYQEILSRHLDNNVKVCFITAFDDYHNEFKKLFPDLKDADYFIRKPVELEVLTKRVKSKLQ